MMGLARTAGALRVAGNLSRLLTWKRARNYAVGICLIYLAAWVYFILAGTAPLNRIGEPIGGDFIAFHTAGRMLLEGEAAELYDPERVREVQRELTNQLLPDVYDPFRNPPFFALLFLPSAALELVPGFAFWSVLNLAFLGLALWLALDAMPQIRPRWRGLVWIVIGFSPVWLGLVGGQNANLSLLLYVLLYRAILHGHERQAGVWAALGLFKPQLFLVFPLIFVISRRWKSLASYCLTASLLGLLSLAMVGPDGAIGFLQIILSRELESGIVVSQSSRMHSLPSFFQMLLPSQSGAALLATIGLSLLLLLPLWQTWRQDGTLRSNLAERWALTSVIAVLINPHLFDYDLSVLVLSGLLLATLVPRARWWVVGFYALLFLRTPVPIGESSVQPTVVLLLALCFWLWRRLSREHEARLPVDSTPSRLPLPSRLPG